MFWVSALQIYGLKKDFIRWIKLLLKNQESYNIKGVQTTNYFKLKRSTRQGDPLSAFAFVIILEIAFIKIKKSPNIKRLNFCNNDFLRTAYADDTTFFIKRKSVTEVLHNFNIMSQFSGLKVNRLKCEVSGIGVMKGVKMVLCGVVCVNLLTNAVKILGIGFPYNKNLENENNFLDHITKLQEVMDIWKCKICYLLVK